MLPLLAAVYSFALIDRINLGVAYTAGMKSDLVLSASYALRMTLKTSDNISQQLNVGARFSIASTLYFVTYIILYARSPCCGYILTYQWLSSSQLPGNLMLPVIGVRNWITGCVIAWGAVSFSMGFVKSWQQLTATRVLLGAFEVGVMIG